MTTTLSSSERAEYINYGKTFHLVLYRSPEVVFYTPPQMKFFDDAHVDSLWIHICKNMKVIFNSIYTI